MIAQYTQGPWLFRAKSDSVHLPPPEPPYKFGGLLFSFHGEDMPSDEDLALILAAPDHALVARSIVAGVARWVPFNGNTGAGELCFGGLCYCTALDEFGVPKLADHTRTALARALT